MATMTTAGNAFLIVRNVQKDETAPPQTRELAKALLCVVEELQHNQRLVQQLVQKVQALQNQIEGRKR